MQLQCYARSRTVYPLTQCNPTTLNVRQNMINGTKFCTHTPLNLGGTCYSTLVVVFSPSIFSNSSKVGSFFSDANADLVKLTTSSPSSKVSSPLSSSKSESSIVSFETAASRRIVFNSSVKFAVCRIRF